MKRLLNCLAFFNAVVAFVNCYTLSEEEPPTPCPLAGGLGQNYRRHGIPTSPAPPPGVDKKCLPPRPDPSCPYVTANHAQNLPSDHPDYKPPGESTPAVETLSQCDANDANCTTPVRRRSSTTERRTRTTPWRISFIEDCDYLAYYCMKAYQTGQLCGRAFYLTYHSFPSYCLLDYVNCMEKFEVWQVVHMGRCEPLRPLTHYNHYPYNEEYFLDQYYVEPNEG